MQRRITALSLLLFVVFCGRTARSDEALVGQELPPLAIETWVAAPEGATLLQLRGHVVLLVLEGGSPLGNEVAVERLNDLRAGWFEKGLRIVAVVGEQPASLPTNVEFSVAVASAEPFGAADAPPALLIAADGRVAWRGVGAEVPEEMLAVLCRKARPFKIRSLDASVKEAAKAFAKGRLVVAREAAVALEHADAQHVIDRIAAISACWRGQVARATAAANAAEAAVYLKWLAKHMAGTSEGELAAVELKALKADKAAAKEIKAAAAYVRLRAEFSKTKGKRKRIDALVKNAERCATRHEGTRGGARADRLARALRADPALSALRAFIAKKKISTTSAGWRTNLPRPPVPPFDDSRTYLWCLETSEGPIQVRLDPDGAPVHVASLLYLTALGYFDGLTFHRVIPGFMAQGGCPSGTGSGNPGYLFAGEFGGQLKHDRPGILSAANAGPGTDGSQFFITFAAAAHLDGKHTAYGEVVEGMQTVKKIAKFGTEGGAPKKRIVIEQATIRSE